MQLAKKLDLTEHLSHSLVVYILCARLRATGVVGEGKIMICHINESKIIL